MKLNISIYVAFLAGLLSYSLFSCTKYVTNENSLIDPPVSTGAIKFNQDLTYGIMTDQCGYTYKTITIGSQTWMAENLRTTKYRNLEKIRSVEDDYTWSILTTASWCNYKNDSVYSPVYGRLYNWYAVNDSRSIAPEGWHVPSDAEWQTLILYLDANADFSGDWAFVSNFASGKLKEKGTSHWFSPNTGSTNETGFTALPGGARDAYSAFELGYAGKSGVWWTSTEGYYGSIYYEMSKGNSAVYRGQYPQTSGYSVRCIKD
jgi:uncharacterized protein (TIGR02145 family)